MTDFKTVDELSAFSDPLMKKQNEDVAKMRTSLLACNDDPQLATYAVKNITVLRVYHQIARIIRYIDMMDRIEDKLYQSLDYTLEAIDIQDPASLMMLLNVQERLQRTMIDSHRLLEPYLNIDELGLSDIIVNQSESVSNSTVIDKDVRDKLRISAQQVLLALEGSTE